MTPEETPVLRIPAIPDRWGNVTVISKKRVPKEVAPGVIDHRGGPEITTLRCDCGTIFEVEGKFSKRLIRYCRKATCPYTPLSIRRRCEEFPSLHITTPGKTKSVYLPADLIQEVDRIAAEERRSFAFVLTALAKEGLAHRSKS